MENTETGCRIETSRGYSIGIEVNSPDEIPEVYYHRKCRSIFTMNRDLEKSFLMKKRRVTKIRS